MKKILSGIFEVLSWGVYVIIVASALITAPILLGYRPMVVLSGSMEPTYPVGSVIYYKATAFDQLQVGDSITYRLGDSKAVSTHRIVSIDSSLRSFVTKGDNNPSPDPTPVSYDKVVGRVAKLAIPYAGYFVTYMQNIFVIGGLGLILLLNMLFSFDNTKDKKPSADRPSDAPAASESPAAQSAAPTETSVSETLPLAAAPAARPEPPAKAAPEIRRAAPAPAREPETSEQPAPPASAPPETEKQKQKKSRKAEKKDASSAAAYFNDL